MFARLQQNNVNNVVAIALVYFRLIMSLSLISLLTGLLRGRTFCSAFCYFDEQPRNALSNKQMNE